MRDYGKVLLAIALALPLGGCKSFLGVSLFSPGAARPVREAPLMAPATQAGRGELDAGRPGAAIEKFRQALAAAEPVAPALNGMAVAYARIGRFDLAQRYFEEAMAADPNDPRYRANLTALVQSPVFAMRRDGDVGARLVKEASQASAAAGKAAAANAAPQPGRLQRVSRSEVRIVTAAAYPAPFAGGRQSVVAAAEPSLKGFKPIVRVALPPAKSMAEAETAGFKPLVRVTLTPSRQAGRSPDASTAPAVARREP